MTRTLAEIRREMATPVLRHLRNSVNTHGGQAWDAPAGIRASGDQLGIMTTGDRIGHRKYAGTIIIAHGEVVGDHLL